MICFVLQNADPCRVESANGNPVSSVCWATVARQCRTGRLYLLLLLCIYYYLFIIIYLFNAILILPFCFNSLIIIGYFIISFLKYMYCVLPIYMYIYFIYTDNHVNVLCFHNQFLTGSTLLSLMYGVTSQSDLNAFHIIRMCMFDAKKGLENCYGTVNILLGDVTYTVGW